MAKEKQSQDQRIDQFFSGPGARADHWRFLVDAAKAWSDGSGNRNKFDDLFAQLEVTEEFHGYPGLRLMAALKEAAASGAASATAALATRILQSLMTKSFRQHASDWDIHDDGEHAATDLLPPSLGRTEPHRPYFELLIVTGVPATNWQNLCAEWRRLRRPLDAFIYEPVFVGSFEDAFCAAMLNPDLAAVVINEGFALQSRHDAPVLRTLTESIEPMEATDFGIAAGAGAEARAAGARSLFDVEQECGGDRRQSGSRRASPDLLFGRGTAGAASCHSGRRPGSVRYAILRQSEEIRPAPNRHFPRAADRPRQIGFQVRLDPRHGRILRDQPFPCREQRHHRRAGQPARADRQHQEGAGKGGARLWRGPRVLRHQRHLHVEQDGGAGAGRLPATS